MADEDIRFCGFSRACSLVVSSYDPLCPPRPPQVNVGYRGTGATDAKQQRQVVGPTLTSGGGGPGVRGRCCALLRCVSLNGSVQKHEKSEKTIVFLVIPAFILHGFNGTHGTRTIPQRYTKFAHRP